MTKLKIKLYNEGNVVVYRVLEQCDSITCKSTKDDLLLTSFKNFSFRSSDGVDITWGRFYNTIDLRGYDTAKDNTTVSYEFKTEQEAQQFAQDALIALKMFADNGYFSHHSQQGVPLNQDNIYEF